MRNALPAIFAVLPLLSSLAFAQNAPAAGPQAAVTAEQVATSIDRGVKFLKAAQDPDGSWPYPNELHIQGATALAVYALSEAGVPADDPSIVKGMDAALSEPIQGTYEAACIALAAAASNPGRYIRALAQTRDYLVAGQLSNGMWAYSVGTVDRGGGDNSNTQFALLGLYAAMSVGLAVPQATLSNAYAHYARTQNGDGGWGYRPGDISYGSMTAAAVASLDITGSRLYVESEKCGQYRTDPKMAAGFLWLVRNFTVRENPRKEPAWHLYYLYALERVGVFTGERYFGGHDWYQEGARVIVDRQNGNGSWTTDAQLLPNTCFALLFLSKGNVPVLINKLVHAGDWNPDVHDARNLSRYVSPHLGQQVGWQTVTLAEPQEALMSAPILYVTGHTFPPLAPGEIERLKSFFDHGGFMLAEACCGAKQFDAGFRAFVEKAFPGYSMTPVDPAHLVYHAVFDVKAADFPLYSVDAGCRTAIIYSAKDLSCAWEKADLAKDEDAFKLGANIAAYATGKEQLVSRLAQYRPAAPENEPATVAAPAAFAFAQAKYAGAWNPHRMAGPKLLEFLNDQAGLYVSARPVEISLTDRNLSNYTFLYMTGLNNFALTAEEKTALKEYLERGGFLFADATAGKAAFDQSFRALMADILPNSRLEPVPHDHPLYHVAFDTVRVQYTAFVRETSPNLDTLTLYGAKTGDRLSVVYSPFDIGCALERQPSYGSRGLLTPDAFRVAANIVLYSLTH